MPRRRLGTITAALCAIAGVVLAAGPADELLQNTAVVNNTRDLMQALAAGADPNAEMDQGVTPLIASASFGNLAAVRALLDAGARVNEDGMMGCTALSWAARNGWAETVDALLDAGADIDHRDKGGLTPLMRAAWNGQLAVVRRLIERGADATIRDNGGNNALFYAIGAGQEQITLVLLQVTDVMDPRNLDAEDAAARLDVVPRTPCAQIPAR